MFPKPLNIGSSHLDRNFGNMRNFSVLIILWTLLILLLSTTTSSPLTCTYWFTQECPGFWKRNPSHIMLARLLFLFIFILVSSFLDYIWNLLNKHTLLLMNVLAWFSGIKWVLINRTMLKWVLYLSKVTTKKNCNGNVLLMKPVKSSIYMQWMKIKISLDGEGFILRLLKSIHPARFLFGYFSGVQTSAN